jgi:hypothetical protein
VNPLRNNDASQQSPRLSKGVWDVVGGDGNPGQGRRSQVFSEDERSHERTPAPSTIDECQELAGLSGDENAPTRTVRASLADVDDVDGEPTRAARPSYVRATDDEADDGSDAAQTVGVRAAYVRPVPRHDVDDRSEAEPTRAARASYIRPSDIIEEIEEIDPIDAIDEATCSPRESYAVLSALPKVLESGRPARMDRPSAAREIVPPLAAPRGTTARASRPSLPPPSRRPSSDSVTAFTARPEYVGKMPSVASPFAPTAELPELDASYVVAAESEPIDAGFENPREATQVDKRSSSAQHGPIDYAALKKFFFDDPDEPKRVVHEATRRSPSPVSAFEQRSPSPVSAFEQRSPATQRVQESRVQTDPLGFRPQLGPATDASRPPIGVMRAPSSALIAPVPYAPRPEDARGFDYSTPIAPVSPHRSWSNAPESASPWVLAGAQPSGQLEPPAPMKLELQIVAALVIGVIAFTVVLGAFLFVRSDNKRFDDAEAVNAASAPTAVMVMDVTPPAPPAASADPSHTVVIAPPPAEPWAASATQGATTTPSTAPATTSHKSRASQPPKEPKEKPESAKSEPAKSDPAPVASAPAARGKQPKRVAAPGEAKPKTVEEMLEELGEEQMRR